MKFLVGLGNPGPKYAFTRHNIGFMAMDHMAHSLGASFKEKWQSLFAKTSIQDSDFVLQKPIAYMNLSGRPVQQALNFFKGTPSDLIIVQDDIDMPFGAIRFQRNRSAGGHNGIKDISQKLGTQDYARLKIGVDRPQGHQPVDQYVLSNFSQTEQEELPFLLQDIEAALTTFLTQSFEKAASKHNRKTLPKEPSL